jgi:TolB-like protein
LVLLLWSPTAGADPFTGRGLLLPIRDRVGDPATVSIVEQICRDALRERLVIADTGELRDLLRRLRIRDLDSAAPAKLDRFAAEMGASWLAAVTLHRAVATPVPEITLSARLYQPGEARLPWARFAAASGLDGRRWLGLGTIDSLDELTRQVTLHLVEQFTGDIEPDSEPARIARTKGGFLARPLSLAGLGPIAVIPFNAVTDRRQTEAAETVTEATLAALSARGAQLLSPGRVGEIQRLQGRLLSGETDRPLSQALVEAAGARSVLTGTVETFSTTGGEVPNPSIAVSARLVDAATGRILWIHGLEINGWSARSVFGGGGIYSTGSLAYEAMSGLLAGLSAEARPTRGEGDQ